MRPRARWIPVLVIINIFTVVGTLLALAVVPTGTRMIVILAPWSEPGQMMNVLLQAGGSLVNGGALDWIVIAEGGDTGFPARLIEAGAMLVLDGRLAQSCLGLVGYP